MLCSFLLGAGYDAYCVTGHAPRDITTADESLLLCPVTALQSYMQKLEKEVAMKKEPNEFEIKPKEPLMSQFDKEKEERK